MTKSLLYVWGMIWDLHYFRFLNSEDSTVYVFIDTFFFALGHYVSIEIF